jgi:hypothetical protein
MALSAKIAAVLAASAAVFTACGSQDAEQRALSKLQREEAETEIVVHRYCAYYADSEPAAPSLRRCLRGTNPYTITGSALHLDRRAANFALGWIGSCDSRAGPHCESLDPAYDVRIVKEDGG